VGVALLALLLAYLPVNSNFGFVPLPLPVLLLLVIITVVYVMAVEAAKKVFFARLAR
jgi:Mg2+-importing ATPase